MAGLDNDRIALVVARSDAGNEVATGYFLTSDLVLTVKHVGTEPGVKKIEVRSGGAELSSNERWSDARVVWTGTGEVDALLLRTARSFADNWQLPTLGSSLDAGRWESNGFAKLAVDDDSGDRKTQPVNGMFGLSVGQGSTEYSLQTNQIISPTWDTYWKGISGAPIFAKPGGELIGIIVEANRAMSNGLVGLPIQRILEDLTFQVAITPSFIGNLPTDPWCLILTTEGLGGDLVAQVDEVLSGFRNEDQQFTKLHGEPVELPVLKAVESVANWARAVEAIARADFLVADVTNFEPAVMLLLGVRSVLRRGVTVSVTRDELTSHTATTPFNVRETRVLPYGDNTAFYDDLHRAMREGAASLAHDPNYLDLPAYHAVRTPRATTSSEAESKNVLVLCSFSNAYTRFFRQLRPILRARTGNLTPRRMMDLRSPRLVGQALYQDIRWARFCIVDWSEWRPNVFFEFGVRLACSDHDPFSIIAQEEVGRDGEQDRRALRQQELLRLLFAPLGYSRANPRAVLSKPLEAWRNSGPESEWHMPDALLETSATFRVAQANYVWEGDETLLSPHVEQRIGAERILGPDRRPERLVLYSANEAFYGELVSSVQEKWIAAWLYLSHVVLSAEEGRRDEDANRQLRAIAQFTLLAISSSDNPRHIKVSAQIAEYIRADGSRRRGPRSPGSGDHDEIAELQASAKNARRDRDWNGALLDLQDAVDLLLARIAESGHRTSASSTLAELAETYGLIGGVERQWGLAVSGPERDLHLKASIDAYDLGYEREKTLPAGKVTTYNRLNRLVGRVLLNPAVLTGLTNDSVDVIAGLEEVKAVVLEQLVERDKDPWVFCDLAMVQLLLGSDAAFPAISHLEALTPQKFVYKSFLDTIKPLKEAAENVRPDLSAAVDQVSRAERFAP